MKKTATKTAYLSQVITASNLQELATQTAKKALTTIYTGKRNLTDGQVKLNGNYDKTIAKMIQGIRQDHHNIKTAGENITDGSDIVQTACLFYCEYIGHKLNSNANNGETTKDGKPIDIYRACLRTVNRYILQAKNRVYKTLYLQDIDENGEYTEYLQVPLKWDMGTTITVNKKTSTITETNTATINDLKTVTQIIKNMNLSVTENKILSARLRGYGYKTIAKKLSLSLSSVKTYLQRIQKKATAQNLNPQTQTA